jgi:hypothetical protein
MITHTRLDILGYLHQRNKNLTGCAVNISDGKLKNTNGRYVLHKEKYVSEINATKEL